MIYLNDNDKHCVRWLADLQKAHLIPSGTIDNRSIADITGEELGEYRQCHFFAGIGGWSRALQLAGWPEEIPVWTGSCPCQPFSTAGKGLGDKDPRHLWPEFRRLIAKCRPAIVFGEQTESKAGREWLAGVQADLEALGYMFAAADLCAAGVASPHRRQRLYWVGIAYGSRWSKRQQTSEGVGYGCSVVSTGDRRVVSVADVSSGVEQRNQSAARDLVASGQGVRRENGSNGAEHNRSVTEGHQRLGSPNRAGCERRGDNAGEHANKWIAGENGTAGSMVDAPSGRFNGSKDISKQIERGDRFITQAARAWNDFDIIECADEKFRRVESGIFPLAHGVPARVAKLRGLGNAIVPQVAAVFIRSVMEVLGIEAGSRVKPGMTG